MCLATKSKFKSNIFHGVFDFSFATCVVITTEDMIFQNFPRIKIVVFTKIKKHSRSNLMPVHSINVEDYIKKIFICDYPLLCWIFDILHAGWGCFEFSEKLRDSISKKIKIWSLVQKFGQIFREFQQRAPKKQFYQPFADKNRQFYQRVAKQM